MSLDQEISDVFGLVGLLLVFVVGYFSAIVPQTDDLVGRPPPDIRVDRERLATRIGAYRKLAIGLFSLIITVLALLAPISLRVIQAWSLSGSFRTLRAGLLVVDVLLLIMGGLTLSLLRRLGRRRVELTNGPKDEIPLA